MKMITIFSMLFGAGLVLMTERAEMRQARLAGAYYRRCLWLMVFGLLHGYGLWMGDILFMYGVCGLLLYPLRRRSPRTLLILGLILVLVGLPLWAGLSRSFGSLFQSPPLSFAEQIELYRGGYWGAFLHRARAFSAIQLLMLPLFGLWRGVGVMLVGMALMRWRVFTADLSWRFYIVLALAGYALGFPIVGWGAAELVGHDFQFADGINYGSLANHLGSLPLTAGHVGVVMLVCKAGLIPRLRRALAAVGQMALTNYLLQTVLCTTFFYGWGLGWFGYLQPYQLMYVVVVVGALQLLASPLWLRCFRYGPMEWLWRSLTYRRLQPNWVARADGGR
jgi:uncharacterized protein